MTLDALPPVKKRARLRLHREPVASRVQRLVRTLLVARTQAGVDVLEASLRDAAEAQFDLRVASSWREASRLLAEPAFDLVIGHLDATALAPSGAAATPDPDGEGPSGVEIHGDDVLSAICGRPDAAPVVVVTSVGDEVNAIRALQAGVQDILTTEQLTASEVVRTALYAMERQRLQNKVIALEREHNRRERRNARDTLTGLPNRYVVLDRLGHALARASRDDGRLAVIAVDLDRFKLINETLGHAVGDEVLGQAARRIAERLRRSDTLGRLGGDEFTVILHDLAHPEDAAKVVSGILSALAEPYEVGGRELFLTASAGIAVHPADGSDVDALMKNATAALFKAKERGSNGYRFYRSQMNERALERLSLENGLRRAVQRQEMVLYYQPQIDAKSGQLLGAEALLRWQHPRFGLLSPARFIGLAEDTGLIHDLGGWVLQQACLQAAAWQRAGHPPIQIAVNVSWRQFVGRDLVSTVESCLIQSGLDPRCLELEITESCVLADLQHTIRVLGAIKALGVRIAIDDFGTGYSSLQLLKQVPTDALKIDRAFVMNIPGERADAAIAATIIRMADAMGFHVIAEGVESEEQLAFLCAHGCPMVQGFLVSQPVPPGRFEQFFGAALPMRATSLALVPPVPA